MNLKRKINIRGIIREDEPLTGYTSFRIGGKADYYAEPADESDFTDLLKQLKELKVPWFILGGGANLLIADKGIRGFVISTANLDRVSLEGTTLTLGAGLPVSDGAAYAADQGLEGLEFIYAMPGSVGGALWMNARCYDGEIASVFKGARILNENLEIQYIPFKAEQWEYKVSPFQNRPWIILSADFELKNGDSTALWSRMLEIREDREDKGHFNAPCGGSTFKNNRDFGAPSGKLIEEAGLKGTRIGGAAVSDWHGNILINEDGASASDMDNLIRKVQKKVKDETGFLLEPEVLKVGDWGDDDAESD